jgi:hypothetical protein
VPPGYASARHALNRSLLFVSAWAQVKQLFGLAILIERARSCVFQANSRFFCGEEIAETICFG